MFNKRAKQAPIEFRNCKIRVEDDPSFIHWGVGSVSVASVSCQYQSQFIR
jgi:hypothetical protein